MSQLTRTEQFIINNVSEREQVAKSVVKRIYIAFRLGAGCFEDAPDYVIDLWREAQERNRFEVVN